jgi:hypothetical protein
LYVQSSMIDECTVVGAAAASQLMTTRNAELLDTRRVAVAVAVVQELVRGVFGVSNIQQNSINHCERSESCSFGTALSLNALPTETSNHCCVQYYSSILLLLLLLQAPLANPLLFPTFHTQRTKIGSGN